ncbi:MAG: flavodoxin [Clostridia bacterium]|jgi:flavodoxin|nr:flavodoxin [Clostridia bacterium]NLS84052.1 flavodoxin [Oscillospiraceae bacterium]
MKKALIAYFSHAGENFVNRKIIPLEIGNTEVAAGIISEITGADMFKIDTETPYPYDYKQCVEVSKTELKANARPKLARDIDVSPYDVIFVGYPCWCGTMPMPVLTFLEKAGVDGKIIMPFCTNEGSRMGRSEAEIKKLCPSSDIKEGLSIHGAEAADAKQDIEKWIIAQKV